MALNLNRRNPVTDACDWSVCLQRGVIVDLQIRRYRGDSSKKSMPSADEYDDAGDAESDYIKLAQRRLIPPMAEKQLKSLETLARQNLSAHSFDCSSFDSQGKFVPDNAYKTFKMENEKYRRQFIAIRNEIIDGYDSLMRKLRSEYKTFAEGLYARTPTDGISRTRFVRQFVDGVCSQLPTKSELCDSFQYNTFLRRIPRYLLDNDTVQLAMRNRNDGTEVERDVAISVTNQSKAILNGFTLEIMENLRNRSIAGSTAILESIDKNNGRLVGRASIGAYSMIRDLAMLDFYGDEELEREVCSLRDALDGPTGNGQGRRIESVIDAATSMRLWATESLNEIRESIPDFGDVSKSANAGDSSDSNDDKTPRAKSNMTNKKAPTKAAAADGKLKISVPKTASRRQVKH